MSTIVFKTPGMHCPSCSMLIEMNVSDLPGIESVSASHTDCTTVVKFDEAYVNVGRIQAEIRSAGYDAEVIA